MRKTVQTINHYPQHQLHLYQHHLRANNCWWKIHLTIYKRDSNNIKWFTFHQVKTKKEAASRRWRIYWAHKQRNEISFVCLTCSAALHKALYFGEYYTQKNYSTDMKKLIWTQTYSISYYFFWTATMSYYLQWCIKTKFTQPAFLTYIL
jgi:hypothetical protein